MLFTILLMLKVEGINTLCKLWLLARKIERANGVSKFKLIKIGSCPTSLKKLFQMSFDFETNSEFVKVDAELPLL